MKLGVGRALTGATALTVAAVVAFPGSAAASPEPPGDGWDHVFSVKGVTVYVEEYGDVISVCDTLANGHNAWVDVSYGSGWLYTAKVNSGAGSCATHRASEGGIYDLKEGRDYLLDFAGSVDGVYLESFSNNH
ncbi:hypothetical protein ACGGAQ_12980 [Micromonospora sp. NPDC047557]|uniref:hypothetical protein n=1 Tax=Micromonospora sp. NPDC047557 TaxID=3364250 RepID=UPI0037217575